MSPSTVAPSPSDVVLVGGLRTPFSRFGGALRTTPSIDLAAHVLRAVLERCDIPADRVDDVFLGFTMPSEYAFDGSIPARTAMLRAGLPDTVRSLTIDRACCSAATAVQLGAKAIKLGEAGVMLAGGAENMGRSSFLMSADNRWGHRRGAQSLKDPIDSPGADIGGKPVAVDAGEVAVEHGIDREQQDAWALRSQERYRRAHADGFFHDEIVSMPYRGKGKEEFLAEDEEPRGGVTLEALAKLPTVYGSPTVTPGNAPGLSTGGCAVALARRSVAEELGLPVLGTIRGWASIARAPRDIAVAPAPALQGAVSSAGWHLDDLDVIEINEAFAAVPLVSAHLLADGDIERRGKLLDRTNVNGGAVALGHPTGASGARLVLTAARELARRGGGRAVAAICGGLGQADAVAVSVP
ncbi:MAG: acetyl-CoA acetyltransferase [Frankiales bacterium]|nr:acetyl-CoA acetyltransferase [Frankiales bacterium]